MPEPGDDHELKPGEEYVPVEGRLIARSKHRVNLGAVLLGFLTVCLTVTLVLLLAVVIPKQDRAQGRDLNAQHEQCLRNNETRVANLKKDAKLIAGNLARRRAWQFYLANVAAPGQEVTGAPVIAFARQQIAANTIEVQGLRRADAATVATQEPVAKYPHAKSEFRRAIVDCDTYFPAA